MKITLKNPLFFISMFLCFHSSYAANIKTNCEAGETVYFSCATGSKIISFCEKQNNAQPASLAYRFSENNKMTFEFSSNGSLSSHKFYKSDVLGASNAGTAIWFKNADFVYALMSPIKGIPFLEVVKHGKTLSRLTCKKDIVDNVDNSSDLTVAKESADYFDIFEKDPK